MVKRVVLLVTLVSLEPLQLDLYTTQLKDTSAFHFLCFLTFLYTVFDNVDGASLVALWDCPGSSVHKESACSVGDVFNPWVRRIPWRGKWQPTQVLLTLLIIPSFKLLSCCFETS